MRKSSGGGLENVGFPLQPPKSCVALPFLTGSEGSQKVASGYLGIWALQGKSSSSDLS